MNILVLMDLTDTQKIYLEGKAPDCDFTYNSMPTDEELSHAEVIIGNPPIDKMKAATSLKWVQLTSAGAQPYCRPGILRSDTQLTNSTGAYGLALAEYMLAVLFAMQKKIYQYHDNQKSCQWHDEGTVSSITDSTILILGLGDLGGTFAKKVKALGAKVIGVKRRPTTKPDYVDELITMDKLITYLPKADVVANCLPGTDATYHLIDKNTFAKMKKGSYFINVGRGTSVVTDDLCTYVQNNHLAGAAIDVTDPEPLPPNHPMWQIKNIHITPHTAGQYHLPITLGNVLHIAGTNLELFVHGKKLHNIVDFTTGYKK